MKKYIGLGIAVILIISGILILVKFSTILFSGFGALQITTNVKSKAYLNDEFIGETPLCKCQENDMPREGEYTLKIIPDDKKLTGFSYKIKINKGVLTAVDRTFVQGSYASAYVLTLEKNTQKEPEILITSIPEGALVSIDGDNYEGYTPFLKKSISEGEHEIEVAKQNYSKKTMRVKTIPYYKLVADIVLGTNNEKDTASENIFAPTPTEQSQNNASPSATPTLKLNTSYSVKVLETPNGFLRVREQPSLSSKEIVRIKTGDIVSFVSEKDGWYEIKLGDGNTGWISSDFSEKIPQ